LRGYSTDAAKAERDWEAKLRAVPSPDSLREYMRRLSARPHHVGSPYDKDNAEWILAKFKGFGLDARIETFDVLFPTPKERVVARHQAQGGGRARGRGLHHLLRSAGGWVRPWRGVPAGSVAAQGRRAARQRDGHAALSRRSAHPRDRGDQGRQAPGGE